MLKFDMLSPEVTVDPFPTYRLLRKRKLISRIEPGDIWAISRFDDVQFVLQRSDLFSSSGLMAEIYRPHWLKDTAQKHLFALEEDPPLHAKHRSFAAKGLIDHIIEALQPLMRSIALTQAQVLRSQRQPEFLCDFAYPYIGTVIGKLIGISKHLSLGQMQSVLQLLKNIPNGSPAALGTEKLEEELGNYFQVLEMVIAARTERPELHLATGLVQAEVEEEKLGPALAREAIDLFFTTGMDTTIGLLCNAMVRLSAMPQLFTELKQHPELIPAFVEEQLRFDPPTHRLIRRTTTEVTLRGITIPANELVLAMVASANRDATHFAEPDDFILGRANIGDHLAFGYGPQACIGGAMARIQTQIALEALLACAGQISCPPINELAWEPSLISHSPDSVLPISLC